MKVWVVVADYGLRGSEVVGAFSSEPTNAQLKALEDPDQQSLGYTTLTVNA